MQKTVNSLIRFNTDYNSAQTQLTKLMAFKNKWKDVPKANGKCPSPEKRPKRSSQRI